MAAVTRTFLNVLSLLTPVSVGSHFWFLVVCCFAASELCAGEIICQCSNNSCKLDAELTLSRPVFKSGTNLRASCTLTGAMGQHCNFTSHDIFFKYLGLRISAEFVTVVNRTTAVLNIPGLKRADSGAHMYCFVNGYVNRLSSGVLLPMSVGQAVIKIADLPEKPRFTGCIVYNWLSMNCTWEPAVQDTGIITEQTLKWTLLPGHYVEQCPLQHNGYCIWPSVEDQTQSVQPYRRDFVYFLTIEAENELGIESIDVRVPTRYKVKPDAVKVESIISHSTSIQLSWFSPVPHFLPQYMLVYNIQVVRMNRDGEKMSTNITASNMTVIYTIDGLNPYTEYLILIKCIPYIDGESKGFWSDATGFSVSTKPDVPGAVPKVTPGGFTIVSEDKKEIRWVDIYWQDIPAEAVHGKYLVTRIRVFEIHQNSSVSCSQSDFVLVKTVNDTCSSELMLLKHVMYAVCVDVYNEVGFNKSSESQPVIIPPEQEDPVTVNFYAQGSGNVITVKWEPLDNATSYTVYWCPGSLSYLCNAQHHLAWQHYSNTTLSTVLTLPAHVTYQSQIVAMSAEYIDGKESSQTTGMNVADCIFSADKDPSLPDRIEVPDNQYLANSLIVRWRKPKCDMTGYIKHFLLVYCEEKRCSQTEAVAEVPVEKHLNGEIQQYIIPHLEENVKYLVKLASVGDNTTSPFSEPISGYVLIQGLTMTNKTLIWLASITGFILLVTVTGYLTQRLYKSFKKKIIISLPQNGEDDPGIATSGLCQDGSNYSTIEGESTLPDGCATSAFVRTTNSQVESESLLSNNEIQISTENNSLSSYNEVSYTKLTDAEGHAMSGNQTFDYVDDDLLFGEMSDRNASILSYAQIHNSSCTSFMERKHPPSDTDLVPDQSESTMASSQSGNVRRMSDTDSLIDGSCQKTEKCRDIILWNHNGGEMRIKPAKGIENCVSSPAVSSSSATPPPSSSSSSSGPCVNGHLSLDQDGLNPQSTTNSGSIVAASSGVASDCSSGVDPETLPGSSPTDGYVVNDVDFTGLQPSESQRGAMNEGALKSQVIHKPVQDALPVCLQTGIRAADQHSTLPKGANAKDPFELLPLGCTGKQWQRDSGISTASMPCSSHEHSSMDSVGEASYIDHDSMVHLVR